MTRYITVLLLLCAGALGSCKKYLSEKQVSNLTQDYFNTEDGLNALISGLYGYARVKHEWDGSGCRLTLAETDAYMSANNTYATLTATRYGSNVSTIAATNVSNFLGADNNGRAPMGTYPHINNCKFGLAIIDRIKP